MDTSDIPNMATIIGSYSYDEGQDFVGGDYVRLIKPASDVMVEVTLPANQYTNNSSAEGVVTYKTYTDENGRFEISLPVPSEGVTATVKPVDFVGAYITVDDVKNGKPVYSYEEVVFTAAEAKLDLKPNAIKNHDGLYTHQARNIDEGYPYVSEYQVFVGMATYSVEKNEEMEDEIVKEYAPAKYKDVIISVKYADGKVLKYVAATDNNGMASFSIPTKEKEWSTTITVEVKAFVVNTFTYFAEEYDEEIGEYVINRYNINGGYYDQDESVSSTVTFRGIEGVVKYSRVKMNFIPFDNVENYGYSKYEWSDVEF